MSEPVSALAGAGFNGFATVAEAGLRGMLTLKGDLEDAKFAAAVGKFAGVTLPGQREIAFAGETGLAWMAPDELLLLLARADAPKAAAALAKALDGLHTLVVDVSDARAVFRVEGAGAGEVLAKLGPVDITMLREGEIRRTRLAQVPAALWRRGAGFEVICFRSVAQYVFDVLQNAAAPGGEVGYF